MTFKYNKKNLTIRIYSMLFKKIFPAMLNNIKIGNPEYAVEINKFSYLRSKHNYDYCDLNYLNLVVDDDAYLSEFDFEVKENNFNNWINGTSSPKNLVIINSIIEYVIYTCRDKDKLMLLMYETLNILKSNEFSEYTEHLIEDLISKWIKKIADNDIDTLFRSVKEIMYLLKNKNRFITYLLKEAHDVKEESVKMTNKVESTAEDTKEIIIDEEISKKPEEANILIEKKGLKISIKKLLPVLFAIFLILFSIFALISNLNNNTIVNIYSEPKPQTEEDMGKVQLEQIEDLKKKYENSGIEKDKEDIEILNQKIKDNSNDVFLYFDRGHLYHSIGDFEKALEDLKKSVSIQPDNYMFQCELGRVYFSMANYTEAVEHLKVSCSLTKTDSTPFGIIGFYYDEIEKNHPQAVEWYEKAIEVDDKNSDLWSNLAIAYLRNENEMNAMDALSKAITLKPDDLISINMLADLCIKNGKLEKGEEYLNYIEKKLNETTIIEKEDLTMALYYNRALINAYRNDETFALDNLKKAAKINYSRVFNEAKTENAFIKIRNTEGWKQIFTHEPS